MTLPRWSLLASLLLCAVPALAQPVTQPFTFSLVEQTLPQIRQGVVAWGDYDGDGDLDALVSGRIEGGAIRTGIFRNDGKRPGTGPGDSTAVFTNAGANLAPVVYSEAAWGDYDGDNDLDLVVQGSRTAERPYTPVTTLYRNDGGTFVAVEAGLPAFHSGTVAWGDYDRDGDADLLLAGVDADDNRRLALLRNDTGTFTEVETSLPGFAFGQARWGDYDNDGDADLLLAGVSDDGFVARVYRNDNGSFANIGAPLDPVAFASVDWGDYDDDGDLDALLSGGHVTPFIMEGATRLYRNDRGVFLPVDAGLTGVLAGAATFGDYDNDGDLDVLVLGSQEVLGRRTARIYRNDGETGFTLATLLVGALFADADWGDYDGDDDLDLLSSGFTTAGPSVTNLYENKRQVKPEPVATLTRIEAVAGTPGTMTLSWLPPAQTGLTYNLRVGTTPGGTDVVSPLADPVTGRRRVFRPGNAQQGTSWTLEGLGNGTYFWSVQALNHAFAPSAFATEGTFTVSGVVGVGTEDDAPLPTRFAVHPNFPNPFAGHTTIPFDLPAPGHVVLRVYDVLGREVAVLANGTHAAGRYTLEWDGRDRAGSPLGAGLYLYELRAAGTRHTGTMTLLR